MQGPDFVVFKHHYFYDDRPRLFSTLSNVAFLRKQAENVH